MVMLLQQAVTGWKLVELMAFWMMMVIKMVVEIAMVVVTRMVLVMVRLTVPMLVRMMFM